MADSKNRGIVGLLGAADHVAVERALAEFRSGRPVVITGAGGTALALPVDGQELAVKDGVAVKIVDGKTEVTHQRRSGG